MFFMGVLTERQEMQKEGQLLVEALLWVSKRTRTNEKVQPEPFELTF